MDMPFDIPFIFAEVNADVCMCIVRQGKLLSYKVDTERVGSLICTKSVGSNRPQDITSTYKYTKGEKQRESISSWKRERKGLKDLSFSM